MNVAHAARTAGTGQRHERGGGSTWDGIHRSLVPSWEYSRGELRHDWLKNTFLNALDAFLHRLDSPGVTEIRLREFLEEDFPTWERRREEIRSLISTFDKAMSPRVLLGRSPLYRLDPPTKAWLADLSDALWRARYPIVVWQRDANDALDVADEAYRNVRFHLARSHAPGREALRGLRPLFVRFRDATVILGDALSAFPRRILVA